MIARYYYKTEITWLVATWPEECTECGEFSNKVMCPVCNSIKQVDQEPVKDKKIIRDLNLFNREVLERLEGNLLEAKDN